MTVSNDAIREIGKALRRHVDAATLEMIVNELLDVPGNRSFRDVIEALARELMRSCEYAFGAARRSPRNRHPARRLSFPPPTPKGVCTGNHAVVGWNDDRGHNQDGKDHGFRPSHPSRSRYLLSPKLVLTAA